MKRKKKENKVVLDTSLGIGTEIDMKCGTPLWMTIVFWLLFSALIVWVIAFAFRGFGRAIAKEEVCICHNVEHNPVTVCSDDDSYKEGHEKHLEKGKDSYGRCVEPTSTPTPTNTPTPTPTAGDVCEEDCQPQPTETPGITPEPKKTGNPGNPPTFAGSSTNAPQCSKENVSRLPANLHVYRNGDQAVVKWIPTEGNKVHVFYKQNSSPDWQYSLVTDNTGYVVIHGLGTMDITFAIQQVNDCGGGITASAMTVPVVDGDSDTWVLFR